MPARAAALYCKFAIKRILKKERYFFISRAAL